MSKRRSKEDILYQSAKSSYYDWMENPNSGFFKHRANLAWRRYRSFCYTNRINPKDI